MSSIFKSTATLILAFVISGCVPSGGGGGGQISDLPPARPKKKNSLKNCSDGINGPGIIGGEKLNDKGPLGRGVVYIRNGINKPSGAACTGTLIANNIVLTAAHCFPDLTADSAVYFSTYPECEREKNARDPRKFKSPQYRVVEQVVIHPDYNPGPPETAQVDPTTKKGADVRNDIAMLRIKDVAPKTYVPIAMPLDFPNLGSSESIVVAGYGKTIDYEIDDEDAGMLQVVELLPYALRGYQVNKAEDMLLSFNQLENKGVCAGDSGGPALRMTSQGLQVIGVAGVVGDPFGGKPTCHGYSLHNSVWFHRYWISETYKSLMNEISSPNPYEDFVRPADHVTPQTEPMATPFHHL